jgi:hypothetical protein
MRRGKTRTLGHMKRALGIAIAAISVAGCSIMPWPHTANVTPKVRGTIERGGKPLANAQIRVATGAKDDVCAGASSESATGPDGAFAVEPVTEFRLLLVVMAHTFFPWSLCYRDGAKWTALSIKKEYALVDSGPVGLQVVRCDVSRIEGEQCQVKWQEH